jgi:hypothetical protein
MGAGPRLLALARRTAAWITFSAERRELERGREKEGGTGLG